MVIETESMVEYNLFFEVKRILESVLGFDDFTYLQDIPDDDKEIVFEEDYVEGHNVKIPCAAINCDWFDEEDFELGSLPGAMANFWVHIYGENRGQTLNIASKIKKELTRNEHIFYDFSTGLPKITDPYSSLVLPVDDGKRWIVKYEDVTQFITKQMVDKNNKDSSPGLEGNFLKRYKCSLNGLLIYNR